MGWQSSLELAGAERLTGTWWLARSTHVGLCGERRIRQMQGVGQERVEKIKGLVGAAQYCKVQCFLGRKEDTGGCDVPVGLVYSAHWYCSRIKTHSAVH